MRGLTLLLFLPVCGAACAASLRPMTVLHGPNVYVHDLFDDAGPNADRLLGPGPQPGGRLVIEAAQLDAIARQFDVGWRQASRADRTVLEWPGHPMKKDDAIKAVRQAIVLSGGVGDIDIEMPGFTPPIVPDEATAAPIVSRLDYDSGSGRFSADLTIAGESMNPIDTMVSGQAVEMLDAPVAQTRLLPDTVLRAGDLRVARVRSSLVRSDVARSLDQVVGMQLRRPVAAGQTLSLKDLVRPPLVHRGATVRILLSVGGLSVSGQAIAMDAGAEGEKVRVQNLTSKAFLFAEVTGPGQVRVTPDAGAALPTLPARYDSRNDR